MRPLYLALMALIFSISLSQAAELVVLNANIYTANSNQDFAEAMAISNGKIIALGSEAEINSEINAGTQIINARGRLVLPGFIDNHNHLFEALSDAAGDCTLTANRNLSQQRRTLRACKANLRRNDWLRGAGYSEEELLFNEPRKPIDILDKIFPNNPVVIISNTSHSVLVNSMALAAANITETSPNPQGGKILKDESGKLTGMLMDNAGDIVLELADLNLANQFDTHFVALRRGLRALGRNGITTVGDGRMYWRRNWYEVWQEMEDLGLLTVRASVRPWVYPDIANDQEQLDFFRSVLQNDLDRLLITNQVKMYSDGASEVGTAKLGAPYAEPIFADCPHGLNYIPQNKMQFWLSELNKIGYGAHIHAIGDGGITESLNAIEAARSEGSEQIYNMTHLSIMKNSDISRFKALDVDADIQVQGQLNRDHRFELEQIGASRANEITFFPVRKLFDAGANLVLSSDWDVTSLSPFASIAEAITNPAIGLPNILDAIDAYTINPAKALGLDALTGSLEPGKSADFIIVNRDITRSNIASNPRRIRRARVQRTYLQGVRPD